MAKGFGAVVTAKEDIERRRNSGGGSFRRYFKLKDGESAVVRFLEEGEDVTSYWAHPVQLPDKRYPTLIPCRDQDMETGERIGEDCPGCEEGLKRRFRLVINVIWRDGPVFEKDEETGTIDWDNPSRYEDHVAVWEVGSEVADDLQILESDYNGLKSRDFKIRRRGKKLDTKYSIVPADVDGGATPLSKSDKELDESKYDLNEITASPSYETWGKSNKKSEDEEPRSEVSAFLKKRR